MDRGVDGVAKLLRGLGSTATPGVVVGAAIAGQPIVRTAVGLASIEHLQALTPSSRMRIASMSKHFTCLAYLLLCEDGLADLDDRIGKYLPEIAEASSGATIRQLMGHISGIRDAFDLRFRFADNDRLVSAANIKSWYETLDSVDSFPGEAWRYNNGGYLLLSLAIEKISKQPLEDFLWERIFLPAGMQDTLLHRWDHNLISRYASLHVSNGYGGYIRSLVNKEHLGEGGVVSTLDDMLRWMHQFRSPSIGSPDTWRKLLEPQNLIDGSSTQYALGISKSTFRGFDVLGHGGSLYGCNSHFLRVPLLDLDVVVLVNSQELSALNIAFSVIDAMTENENRSDSEVVAQPFSGVFQSTSSDRVLAADVAKKKGTVWLDGDELIVLPTAEGDLRPGPFGRTGEQAFKPTFAGNDVTSIHLRDHGRIEQFIRLPRRPERPGVQLAGHYSCLRPAISLKVSDDVRTVETICDFGRSEYRLLPLGDGIWRMEALGLHKWGGVLRSTNDDTLTFSSSRTRSLSFERVV